MMMVNVLLSVMLLIAGALLGVAIVGLAAELNRLAEQRAAQLVRPRRKMPPAPLPLPPAPRESLHRESEYR